MSGQRKTTWHLLKHPLIRVSYYYAVSLGIISTQFDFKRRQLKQPTFLKYYAFAMNVLIVGLAPVAFHYGAPLLNFYNNNKLMKFTNMINLGLRFSVVLLTIIFRWQREPRVAHIVAQLLQLEVDYFDEVQGAGKPIIQRFQRLFYAKYFSVCFQILAVTYVFVEFTQEYTLTTVLVYIYFLSTVNILNGVMFHYFIILWHMCRRFYALNARLEEIFDTLQRSQQCQGKCHTSSRSLKQLQRALAAEVFSVAQTHFRLTNLVFEFNECYKFQILAVLLAKTFNNVALGYYGLILFGSRKKSEGNVFGLLFGIFRYGMTLWDVYLVDLLCDSTTQAYRETAEILKRFHEFEVMEMALGKSCEVLSLLLKRKLEINICGMFVLNKRSSFIMLTGILQQTIILLQFDVEKRFG